MRKYCSDKKLALEKIFTVQMIGESFNRPKYLILKEDVLCSGNELVVTELDCSGRNVRMILENINNMQQNVAK